MEQIKFLLFIIFLLGIFNTIYHLNGKTTLICDPKQNNTTCIIIEGNKDWKEHKV